MATESTEDTEKSIRSTSRSRLSCIRCLCVLCALCGQWVLSPAWAAEQGRDNRIPDEALAILGQAEHLTVFSVDPVFPKTKPREDFHGWRVRGKTVVADPGTRASLVTALKHGVDEHRGEMMRCFIPRHAVRATHGGKTADVVICFECYNARVYVDGRQLPGFLVSQSPEPAFARVLAGGKMLPAPQR